MTDDDLDDLLTPRPASGDARREAIFAKTLPLLQARRWARLAWPAVFAAGLVVGWFARPTPVPERIVETVIQKELVPVPVEVSPGEQVAEWPPARLELDAEQETDPVRAARLFRQAGDAYLKADNIEAAIRCYREHLGQAGPDGREVRADDSWLLTSIKNSKPRG